MQYLPSRLPAPAQTGPGAARRQTRMMTERSVLECLPPRTPPRVTAGIVAATRMLLSCRSEVDIQNYNRTLPPGPGEDRGVICGWPRWLLHIGIAPPALSSQIIRRPDCAGYGAWREPLGSQTGQTAGSGGHGTGLEGDPLGRIPLMGVPHGQITRKVEVAGDG